MAPQISWHRGGKELAPSATLAAFQSAAERGAEWIEVDVRRTCDGVLVCVHDAHVGGLGKIADLDYGSLDSGQRVLVPTFAEFLATLARGEEVAGGPHRCGVHLDLKGTGHEVEAVEMLRREGRSCFVTTEHDESVHLVRSLYADVPALLSLGRLGTGQNALGRIRVWCSDLWPYARLRRSGASGIAVMFLLAHPRLRKWCASHNLTVLVWTVDSTSGLKRWLARPHVDIVTTDRPVVARRLRDGS